MKFEAEGQEFSKYLKSLEQFIETVHNYNSNWKKILGFRNLQEKLENQIPEHLTKNDTNLNLKNLTHPCT